MYEYLINLSPLFVGVIILAIIEMLIWRRKDKKQHKKQDFMENHDLFKTAKH